MSDDAETSDLGRLVCLHASAIVDALEGREDTFWMATLSTLAGYVFMHIPNPVERLEMFDLFTKRFRETLVSGELDLMYAEGDLN